MTKILMYVPHGIDSKKFYPIEEGFTDKLDEDLKKLNEVKSQILGTDEVDFVVLFNNRNIRRKQTSNIILAFNNFIKMLPKEKADRCVLILHTQPVDENGTDLIAVVFALAPDAKVIFSSAKVDYRNLNCLYNIADVTISMSNAEGFGLSTAESIMSGTPIIATVTGGLQDQMRFVDSDGKLIEFDIDWSSNSNGRYKNSHGAWAFPLFPKIRSITGSPLTPFIFDDFCDWEDATSILYEVYNMEKQERKRRGKMGREWMCSKESGMELIEMCSRFINGIDETFNLWKPRKRYEIYKIESPLLQKSDKMGVSLFNK